MPANEKEENEQLRMVMMLSKQEKEAETEYAPEVSSNTKTIAHKNLSEGEAATVLLSMTSRHWKKMNLNN